MDREPKPKSTGVDRRSFLRLAGAGAAAAGGLSPKELLKGAAGGVVGTVEKMVPQWLFDLTQVFPKTEFFRIFELFKGSQLSAKVEGLMQSAEVDRYNLPEHSAFDRIADVRKLFINIFGAERGKNTSSFTLNQYLSPEWYQHWHSKDSASSFGTNKKTEEETNREFQVERAKTFAAFAKLGLTPQSTIGDLNKVLQHRAESLFRQYLQALDQLDLYQFNHTNYQKELGAIISKTKEIYNSNQNGYYSENYAWLLDEDVKTDVETRLRLQMERLRQRYDELDKPRRQEEDRKRKERDEREAEESKRREAEQEEERKIQREEHEKQRRTLTCKVVVSPDGWSPRDTATITFTSAELDSNKAITIAAVRTALEEIALKTEVTPGRLSYSVYKLDKPQERTVTLTTDNVELIQRLLKNDEVKIPIPADIQSGILSTQKVDEERY